MGGYSTTADVSSLAVAVDLDAVASLLADAELDVDVILSRITGGVALASSVATAQADLTTLLSRITAGVALASAVGAAQTDLTTLLSRITAGVALASALTTAQNALDLLLLRAPEAIATVYHVTQLLARVPGEVLQSIKSIQRGQIIWSGGTETSLTATVTAVNVAKSLLFFQGAEMGSAAFQGFRLGLTNSTTITATRNAATTLNGSVGFQLVEFN